MNAFTKLPAFQQPQVPKDATLLCEAYLHDGLSLDLYGTHGEDGYEVTSVSLAGATVDLFGLVPSEQLEAWNRRLSAILPGAAQLRKESRNLDKIERALWDSLWTTH